MRFFKFGESLAFSLPESIRKKYSISEKDEFEFVDLEDGLFILAKKDKLNNLLKEKIASKLPAEETPVRQVVSPVASSAKPTGFVARLVSELNKNGFVVVFNEPEAKQVSSFLEEQVRGGQVFGVRGFDKKYYILKRDFFEAIAPSVARVLAGKDADPQTICRETKLSEPACIAVLQLLKENGEVIEKKRGLFKLVH